MEKIEYWDVYDKNKQKTGRLMKRGELLKEDEYHLIVHIWIKNSKGEFLIQQRSETVKNPLVWSATGGSVVAGEDSYTGAIREVKEELGLDLTNHNGYLFDSSLYEEENQKYLQESIREFKEGKVVTFSDEEWEKFINAQNIQ